MFLKPRLGRRRWSGIWPPSKPRIMREPLRERCPLCPRAEVLPIPDPIPRPTRFLLLEAFLGARRFDKFIVLLHDLDQVRNLCDHTANRWRVGTLDHLVKPSESQTFHDQFV